MVKILKDAILSKNFYGLINFAFYKTSKDFLGLINFAR